MRILITLLLLLSSCAPGRPQCQVLGDGIKQCPTEPTDAFYLGRSGFWQRAVYVTKIQIREARDGERGQ